MISKQEQIANTIRYAGEYYDEETGLYYLRARYYDPIAGRFMAKDSVEGDIIRMNLTNGTRDTLSGTG